MPADSLRFPRPLNSGFEASRDGDVKNKPKPRADSGLFLSNAALADRKTIQEYGIWKLGGTRPAELSTHSTLAVSRSIERQGSPVIDPRIYKKNSYEVFKLLKQAVRKFDRVCLKVGFRRISSQLAARPSVRLFPGSQTPQPLHPSLARLRPLLLRKLLRMRKSNPAFKSKFAELNDLRILAKRAKGGNPQSELQETICLLQEDLKFFVFHGRFCFDQRLVDEKVQNCLESEANSETPQVLASESVSSIQGNLRAGRKRARQNESLKDYSNTLNHSSQMTNADQSSGPRNMFKKLQKNNMSESRVYFKPKIESAKINFINIKSKIDCWNVPAKRGRPTADSEGQGSVAEPKDLTKLRERFKSQYSKPFLKSIKRLDVSEAELSVSRSKPPEPVNIYQNKLVPKVSFSEMTVQVKKSASRARDIAFKPTFDVARGLKASGVRGGGRQLAVARPAGEARGGPGDKLSFEEIKDTYVNKYLSELGRLFERAVDRVPSRIDNFEAKAVTVNGEPIDGLPMTGSLFTELSNLLNRRFDMITNA